MKKLSNRIISMNDETFDELYIQELENRLETDPLVPGGLIELIQSDVTVCPCDGGEHIVCPCHGGTYISGCTCYEGTYVG